VEKSFKVKRSVQQRQKEQKQKNVLNEEQKRKQEKSPYPKRGSQIALECIDALDGYDQKADRDADRKRQNAPDVRSKSFFQNDQGGDQNESLRRKDTVKILRREKKKHTEKNHKAQSTHSGQKTA
jgi:hypothetical protein